MFRVGFRGVAVQYMKRSRFEKSAIIFSILEAQKNKKRERGPHSISL
jgi:predicted transcriptional regulator